MSEGGDVSAVADGSVTGNQVKTSRQRELCERITPTFRVRIAHIGNSVGRNQVAGDQGRSPFVENRDRAGRARPLRRDQAQRTSNQFEHFVAVDQAVRRDHAGPRHSLLTEYRL
jgi:hypothetical protein